LLTQIKQQDTLGKNEKDELFNYVEELQGFIDSLEHLFILEDTIEYVKWIEIEADGDKNAANLYSESTDISNILYSDFLEVKESVILTIYTLKMRKSFSYIEKRIRITTKKLIKEKIASPFSYENQVQMLIPNDFPDIKYGNMDDYIYSVSEAI